MKKILYFVLAAALIVASCAKEPVINDEKTPVNPSGETTALFSASIIQPNGLDGATKVSIVDDPATDKVFINWDLGDKIWVLPCGRDDWYNAAGLYAVAASADTDFTGDIPEQSENYTASYFGPDDVWKDYVLGSSNNIFVNTINPVALQNMPLYCVQSTRNGGRNYLQFSCEYAILQVNVPSKLEYDNLYVCVDDLEVEFENGIKDDSSYTLCVKDAGKIQPETGKDFVKIFVPIPAAQYDKITLVASKGEDTQEKQVAWMQTYCAENNPVSVAKNTIYFFDFCNTQTINAAGEYTLVQNGIDYKINISADIQGEVTINANATEGAKPANIFINARGHKINNLVVNAPESHVEVSNGESVSAKAITSLNTFVVKGDYKITGTEEGEGLTVEKGSVVIEGDEGATNVKQVIIPENVTEQIKIDVSGVSTSTESERVKIVNNSETPVVVVPDNVDDQKSYQVEKGDVTPVSKETVAMIGTTGYETLAAAVEAVQTSETITLIKDLVLSEPVVTDKTFTLTLNANISPVSTWEGGGYKDGIIIIKRGGNLTINGSGKILNNDVKKAYAAVKMTQKDEPDGAAAKLTVGGTVTLEGYYYGIVGGGNRHNTEITINGGTIKGYNATDCQGIYHPQDGKLTINGGEVSGFNSAIELRGGTFVINGGTLTCTASPLAVESNGSGSTTMGAALAIAQHTTKKDINVTVNGGTLNGYKAISVTNPENNDTENVAVTYKAGTLNGGITLGHGTFKLDGNLEVIEPVMVIGKTTLDLGNATLKAKFTDTKNNIYAPVIVSRGGDLTIKGNDGKINSGAAYGGVQMINPKDTGDAKAKLTVNSGTIEGHYYGIVGNGNRHNTEITINGGIVKGLATNDNAGIFHPQNGTLTINGGTIEGATGIYVKSGSVSTSISAGTIKGIGEKKDYVTTGDGFNQTGDAIVFDNCDYPGGAPNASIEGGKFLSTYANAIGSYAKTGKDPITGFISGGLFSTKPAADLIVEGKAAVENTDDATKATYPWKVAEAQAQGVAKIGSTYYETLEEAINAAEVTDVIELFAGEYTTYGTTYAQGKTLIFKGIEGETIWKYGKNELVNGEGGSDYSFEGSTVTFNNITLADNYTGNSYFRGFVRAAGLTFNNCTIKNMMGYLGVGDVHFTNCVFDVASVCEYAVKCYSGKDFYFDGCTFKGNNKANLQLYIQDLSETVHKVQVKDCKFYRGSDKSRTAVYYYDQSVSANEGGNWEIHLDGINENLGDITVNQDSGSWLWGSMKHNSTDSKTTIY